MRLHLAWHIALSGGSSAYPGSQATTIVRVVQLLECKEAGSLLPNTLHGKL